VVGEVGVRMLFHVSHCSQCGFENGKGLVDLGEGAHNSAAVEVPTVPMQRCVPPAGPAWCSIDKPTETFSMACWIPIAKRMGRGAFPVARPARFGLCCSHKGGGLVGPVTFGPREPFAGLGCLFCLLRNLLRSMVLNALKMSTLGQGKPNPR
jgi:hypothetical protein